MRVACLFAAAASCILPVWVKAAKPVPAPAPTPPPSPAKPPTCPEPCYLRREVGDLTDAEFNDFAGRVHQFVTSGKWIDFATFHSSAASNAPSIHRTAQFLPWHRQFLDDLEAELQKLDESKVFRLPYWQWTLDASDMGRRIFTTDRYGQFTRRCLSGTPFQFQSFSPCVTRGGSSYKGSLPAADGSDVEGYLRAETYEAFRTGLEYGLHNNIHVGIGGTMATMLSPMDPIFLAHHGYVDKIWADWQKRGAGYATAYDPTTSITETLVLYPWKYNPSAVQVETTMLRVGDDVYGRRLRSEGEYFSRYAEPDCGELCDKYKAIEKKLAGLTNEQLAAVPRHCGATRPPPQGGPFSGPETEEAHRRSQARSRNDQPWNPLCLDIADLE